MKGLGFHLGHGGAEQNGQSARLTKVLEEAAVIEFDLNFEASALSRPAYDFFLESSRFAHFDHRAGSKW